MRWISGDEPGSPAGNDCNEYSQPKASLVKGRGTALAVEGLRSLRYGVTIPPPFGHPTGPLAGKACSTLWLKICHRHIFLTRRALSQGRLLAACSNSQATASTVGAALAAARQERLNMDMKSSMKQFPCISLRATARVAPTVYHVFLIIHVCCIVPSDCNEYGQLKPPLSKGGGPR